MDVNPNQRLYLSNIFSNKNRQINKILYQGEYKIATYLPYSQLLLHKLYYVRSLRTQDSILAKDTNFNSQIHIEVIKENRQNGEPQSCIIVQSKFVEPSNIIKRLESKLFLKQQRLDLSKKADLIDKIMKKVILTLMTSTNYQIYTWKDLSLVVNQNDNLEFQINKSAMTGMNLLLFEDNIQFQQFAKIYEIISISSLKQQKLNFSYQMKIRAIAKILLILITQRYFELLQVVPELKIKAQGKHDFTKAECLQLLQKRRDLFQQLFQNEEIVQQIRVYEKQNNLSYFSFLEKVFVKDYEFQWSEMIQLVLKKQLMPKEKVSQVQVISKTKNNLLEIIDKLVKKFIKPSHEEQLFQSLGLYRDYLALFLAIMHLQTDSAEQVIGYLNIDDFLNQENSTNFIIKNEIFRFLMRLKAGQFVFNFRNNNKINQNTLMPQNYIQSRETPACPQKQEEQKQDYSEKQFNQMQKFLFSLNTNFGVFKMKIRKYNFDTQNYYSQGFRKYRNLFK